MPKRSMTSSQSSQKRARVSRSSAKSLVSRIPRGLKMGPPMYVVRNSLAHNIAMNSASGLGTQGYGMVMWWELGATRIIFTNGGTQNSAVAGTSDISNLFETYKLYKVETTFVWTHTDGIVANANNFVPVFYVAFDPNDKNQPINEDGICQLQHEVWRGDKPLKRTYYPKTQGSAYNGTNLSDPNLTQMSGAGTEFNAQYNNIEFYGVKLWWNAARTTNTDFGNLQIYNRLFFKCKGLK